GVGGAVHRRFSPAARVRPGHGNRRIASRQHHRCWNDVLSITYKVSYLLTGRPSLHTGDLTPEHQMITAPQLRAARALLGIDQRRLAELAGVSLPTIQRMEASEGTVRGVVGTLTKVVEALEACGVELIGNGQASAGLGRG